MKKKINEQKIENENFEWKYKNAENLDPCRYRKVQQESADQDDVRIFIKQ